MAQSASRSFRRIALPLVVLALAGASGYAWQSLKAEEKPQENSLWVVLPQDDIIAEVQVQSGQAVKKGDLLLVLDDSQELAALAEAEENLQKVMGEAGNAEVAFVLPGFGSAPLMGSKWVEVPAGTIVAREPARTSVSTAESPNVAKLENQADKAEADAQAAEAAGAAAEAKISAARAAIAEAKAEADAANAKAVAAKIDLEAANQKATKNAELLELGAVSARVADKYKSAVGEAEAQVQAAEQAARAAEGAVQQRELELKALEADVAQFAAKAGHFRKKASSAAEAAKSQPKVKSTTTEVVRTVRRATTMKRVLQPIDLPPAPPEPQPVEVDLSAKKQVDSKIQAARDAVDAAEKALEATRVYAAFDGRVSSITAVKGQRLNKGAAVIRLSTRP